MNPLKKGILLLAGSALMALHCSSLAPQTTPGQIAGNGSSVGPGIVNGTLYEPGGKRPANGAVVVVRYKNATAMVNTGGSDKAGGALYTTLTNTSGAFAFDTLGSGLYVVEGSDDKGNMVIFDSILIDASAKPLNLPPDTLEPAGAIRGAVSLKSGGNPLQTFVLAFGVDRFCQVSSDGNFLFKGFARGLYTLKIISLDPVYGALDTAGIVVRSGDTTTIGTIELPVQKLPAPALKLTYDTMRMEVILSWRPTPAPITRGYLVYSLPGSSFLPTDSASLLSGLLTDTIFKIPGEGIGSTSSYYVSLLDKGNNKGPKSNAVSVTISSKLEAYDSVRLRLPADNPEIMSLSINKNDEFVVVFAYRHGDASDFYNYHINRYSRNGEQISSYRVADTVNLIHQVNGRDSAGNCFFAMGSLDSNINLKGGFWYLCTMLPSGDFLKPIPIPDSLGRWGWQAAVVNSMLYVGINGEIRRMDLATGNIVSWKQVYSEPADLSGYGLYSMSLLPYNNEGILVETYIDFYGKPPAVCYDNSGVELFSIPRTNCIVATDSMMVYFDELYRISASGKIREAKSGESWEYAAVSSDKTLYTLSDNGKLSMRRFPE
jgi:hypothetical protein